MSKQSQLLVKYVYSSIGCNKRQRQTVKCLGLTRLGQVRALPDTDAVRNMVRSVTHLVQIVQA